MSRYIDPVPQYLDDNGDPLVNAKLWFFKSGTNTQLTTYADSAFSIPNTNPIELGLSARVPNVFFEDVAKVILTSDKPEYGLSDQQVWERDPVGGSSSLGSLQPWGQVVIYDANDYVLGSDGEIYRSITNDNQGNDPTTSPEEWEQVRFIGVWNINLSYSTGDIVQTSDGNLWKSIINNNVSNNPSADDGSNWVPAIDGSKVPEIQELENLNDWKTQDSDFSAVNNNSYQIDASSNTVDVTLPAITENNSFIFYNQSTSTNKVQILNPSYTIVGPAGTILAGTDIELEPSNSVQLVAKSTTVLEIVGVQV